MIYQPKFHPKEIEELILITGWQSIEETAIWCHMPSLKGGRIHRVPFDRLVSVESMTSSVWIADKYERRPIRLWPGRIEMLECDRPHRVTMLEPREPDPPNFYRILCEEFCPCYFDGEREHEGSIFFYTWCGGYQRRRSR